MYMPTSDGEVQNNHELIENRMRGNNFVDH